MKLKSLAMLAASGLMAASFAYIAPAMADDATTNGQVMQPAAPSSSDSALPGQTNGSASSTDTSGNAQTGSASPTDNGSTPPAAAPAAPSSGDDAGNADTATGDDDY